MHICPPDPRDPLGPGGHYFFSNNALAGILILIVKTSSSAQTLKQSEGIMNEEGTSRHKSKLRENREMKGNKNREIKIETDPVFPHERRFLWTLHDCCTLFLDNQIKHKDLEHRKQNKKVIYDNLWNT